LKTSDHNSHKTKKPIIDFQDFYTTLSPGSFQKQEHSLRRLTQRNQSPGQTGHSINNSSEKTNNDFDAIPSQSDSTPQIVSAIQQRSTDAINTAIATDCVGKSSTRKAKPSTFHFNASEIGASATNEKALLVPTTNPSRCKRPVVLYSQQRKQREA
jgi:hypothetical protein